MPQEIMELNAGRLICSPIENAVNKLKFAGYDISLWMGKGLLCRPIVIKGDSEPVGMIRRWLIDLQNDQS